VLSFPRDSPTHAEEKIMPIYEFRCRECKKKFQVVRSIAEYDPKKVTCPKCNTKKVDRVWSGISVQTSKKS
jgi:putative FmdB family regulatory protein